MNFTTYIGEDEVEALVEYSFTPELPAKINCLPEDAYPAEAAEITIESVSVCGVKSIFGRDIYSSLSPAIKERLVDESVQDVINNAIDFDEQKSDWDRSQREEF